MSIDIDHVEQMESAEFAGWVGELTDADLRGITGADRARLLDYVFGAIPAAFQAARAGDGRARIDFAITGEGDPDRYAVVVQDGQCRIEKPPTEVGAASLTLGLAEFLRLIVGTANPVTMVMFGKIKVGGELSQVLAFQRWFDMPRA